ncbi:MAG: DUF4157 domain-containing protein, partial [Longimicrobiales bacterium]
MADSVPAPVSVLGRARRPATTVAPNVGAGRAATGMDRRSLLLSAGNTALAQSRPMGHRDSEAEAVPPISGNALTGPGRALEPAVRAYMELRLARDFGRVRVHDHPKAAESARSVGAVAYTIGNDITFDTGRYAPYTPAGLRLLSHELAHVLQQRRGGRSPSPFFGDSLDREANRVADSVLEGRGRVSVGGASSIGLARQTPEGEPAAPSGTKVNEAVKDMTAIRQKYDQLRGTIDEIAADPAVKERLSHIAARSGQAQQVVETLRGELTEEVMNREIAARLETGVGLDQILPKKVAPGDILFIEGNRILDLDGSKLTDGMLVRRQGNALEVLTIFEAKAGQATATELHGTKERVKDPAKIRAKKGREPTKKELEKWEELQKVKGETPEGKVIQRELGGQVRHDIERLREDGKIRLRKVDASGKLLDAYDEVAVNVSRRTLFVGVAPTDVSLSAQTKAFKKEPGIRYKSWNLPARKAEIAKAAREMRAAATKLGGATPGAAPSGAGAPKPAADTPGPQPKPKPKAITPTPATPPKTPKAAAEGPPRTSPEAEPGKAPRPEQPKPPVAEATKKPKSLAAAKAEPPPPRVPPAEPNRPIAPGKRAAAEALEGAIEKTAIAKTRRAAAREVVTKFLQKQAAMTAGRRVGSLVPVLGWYASFLDAKEGISDIAHGNVVLGLYTIGLAGVDVVSDVLHAADTVSGVGGTALSLTVQGWTTAQQVAIAQARSNIRSRELTAYIEKNNKLPPRKELMDYYGLNDEEVLLLESDFARAQV